MLKGMMLGTMLIAGVAQAQTAEQREAIIAGDEGSGYIHIDSLGPCVVTEGADSAEVKDLGKL